MVGPRTPKPLEVKASTIVGAGEGAFSGKRFNCTSFFYFFWLQCVQLYMFLFGFFLVVNFIKNGEFIQPYCGILRCEKCVKERYPGGSRVHKTGYLMLLDDQMESDFRLYVDADISSCEMPDEVLPSLGQSRKINSSRGTRFKPNVDIQELNFFATRDILPGEELLADYPHDGLRGTRRPKATTTHSSREEVLGGVGRCSEEVVEKVTLSERTLTRSSKEEGESANREAQAQAAAGSEGKKGVGVLEEQPKKKLDIFLDPINLPATTDEAEITSISLLSGLTIQSLICSSGNEMCKAIMSSVPFDHVIRVAPSLRVLEHMGENEAAAVFRAELGNFVNRYRPTKHEISWLRSKMVVEASPSSPSRNDYVPLSWSSFAELCLEPGRILGDLGWQVAADYLNIGVTIWTLSPGWENIIFNRRLIPSFGPPVLYDVNIVEEEQPLGGIKLFIILTWGGECPASEFLPVTQPRGVLAVHEKAKIWQSYMVERRVFEPPITLLNAYVNVQAMIARQVCEPLIPSWLNVSGQSLHVVCLQEKEAKIEVCFVDDVSEEEQECDSCSDDDCKSSQSGDDDSVFSSLFASSHSGDFVMMTVRGGASSQPGSAGSRCVWC